MRGRKYRPLSKRDLAEIEQDFEDILSKKRHRFLEGGLREYRVHFILRSFKGFLNYDIDNLLYRPENNWKSMAISIKNRLHDLDFPYTKLETNFHSQLIYNDDYNEFSLADVRKQVWFTGDRDQLEEYLQELLFEDTFDASVESPEKATSSLDRTMFPSLQEVEQEEES